MNILWLDHPTRYNRFDDWLHFKFAKKMAEFCTVHFYAPELHNKCPEMTPIAYDESLTLKEINSRLNIDIVILDTRASAYDEYWPKSIFKNHEQGKEWLPPDFSTCETARKICIEEDFHYETDLKWHREKGFHILFQRHYNQSQRKMGMPFYYLPFSVDRSYFKDHMKERQPYAGFASTHTAKNSRTNKSIYLFREHAANMLKQHGLLAEDNSFKAGQFEHEKYINYLNRYIGHIACGSLFGITPSKMFEIMASGSVLFMNKTPGIETLFPEGSYIEYIPMSEDILHKFLQVRDNDNYRKRIVEKAIDCIENNHTHEIRIRQFFDRLGVKI